MLGAPPTFALSQDQTLQFILRDICSPHGWTTHAIDFARIEPRSTQKNSSPSSLEMLFSFQRTSPERSRGSTSRGPSTKSNAHQTVKPAVFGFRRTAVPPKRGRPYREPQDQRQQQKCTSSRRSLTGRSVRFCALGGRLPRSCLSPFFGAPGRTIRPQGRKRRTAAEQPPLRSRRLQGRPLAGVLLGSNPEEPCRRPIDGTLHSARDDMAGDHQILAGHPGWVAQPHHSERSKPQPAVQSPLGATSSRAEPRTRRITKNRAVRNGTVDRTWL